jgi:carbamoyltransferase
VVILGINAYHGDASACVLRDGALVAAAEEERFRRVKHWAGFPSEAIRYCLRAVGIRLVDVSQVAINQDSKANLWKKVGYLFARRPDLSLVLDRICSLLPGLLLFPPGTQGKFTRSATLFTLSFFISRPR